MNEDRRARDEAELRAQLAERRTATAEKRARTAEAQNTQLVAAMHAMREVLDEIQEAADLALQSSAAFQAGSAKLSKVIGALLDAVAIPNLPDSPEGIWDR